MTDTVIFNSHRIALDGPEHYVQVIEELFESGKERFDSDSPIMVALQQCAEMAHEAVMRDKLHCVRISCGREDIYIPFRTNAEVLEYIDHMNGLGYSAAVAKWPYSAEQHEVIVRILGVEND